MKKYSYEELITKADQAKTNALKAKENKSFWAFCFWWDVGEKLHNKAMNMKLADAKKI